MKKNILTVIFLSIAIICSSQTTTTKYFKDQYCSKEVSQEKANFSVSVTKNADGTTTKETKNIKSGVIIYSSTYKGDEPFGVWIYQSGNGPDTMFYNFNLVYSEQKCNDSISTVKIDDYLQNNDSIGYKAPTFGSGGKSLNSFLMYNIVYPVRAKDNGIMGKVDLSFTITMDGNIENIIIVHGTNVLLDKEAVRVIRKIKFSSPPTIHGQKQNICVAQSVKFVLQ